MEAFPTCVIKAVPPPRGVSYYSRPIRQRPGTTVLWYVGLRERTLNSAFVYVCLQGVKISPACEEAGVKAFPTWVINGTLTEGELDLNALEAMLQEGQGGSSTPEAAAAVAEAQ